MDDGHAVVGAVIAGGPGLRAVCAPAAGLAGAIVSDASPLETEIRRLISVTGPMPVAQYMALCLTHPQHGYYVTRDPLGAAGDFTTAPEISQMFGELLGLWAVSVWRMMGEPEKFRLIELGPGRGTMMRDALRVSHVVPEFRTAASVHFVEVSPVLEEEQRRHFEDQDVPVHWHKRLEDVPEDPTILLANEFIDALPVYQAVKEEDGWHERRVGLDALGNLALGLAPDAIPHFDRILPAKVRAAPVGSVYEWRQDLIALEIARRVRDNGAALVIDYGPGESDVGDTLQAVKDHTYARLLSAPGLADLTAHVDFQTFGRTAEALGVAVHGPVAQGEFLRRLGIAARADGLKANATQEQAAAIGAAMIRLTRGGRKDMGDLFKVIALSDPKLGALPGFEA
jgi:NADH dehydrogenase [ubiquinone] 1 alpha subcomplex assembly factor 7